MFLSYCVSDDFFFSVKKLGFWVFLVHPTVVSVLLSASVKRCFVSRMRDFFHAPCPCPLSSINGLKLSLLQDGSSLQSPGGEASSIQPPGREASSLQPPGQEASSRPGRGREKTQEARSKKKRLIHRQGKRIFVELGERGRSFSEVGFLDSGCGVH